MSETLKHVRCFWCGLRAEVDAHTGACKACHELAHSAWERYQWIDWFIQGCLIILIAALVGTIIYTMGPL